MEESEEYEFEDSFGGVFSTEMFETNLRIEGEMRGKEYSKIYFNVRSTTFLSDINTFFSKQPRKMQQNLRHVVFVSKNYRI